MNKPFIKENVPAGISIEEGSEKTQISYAWDKSLFFCTSLWDLAFKK